MRRLLGALCAGVLLTTGCTGDTGGGGDGGRPPTADQVAAATADALQAGDVSGVDWVTGTGTGVQASYVETRGALADLRPEVEVSGVAQTAGTAPVDSPDATATLTWSWPVGPGDDAAGDWTYSSELPLYDDAGTWRPGWLHSVVHPDLADTDTLTLRSRAAPRGRVLGGGGTVLVTDRPVVRVGLDKTVLPPQAGPVRAAARELATLVGVDVRPFVKLAVASGPAAFVEAITYREGEVPPDVDAGLGDVRGARRIAGTLPLAPTRDFAASLLGRVGPVTAEMVEKAPTVYRAGDVAGLSGLQARYDEQLRGRPGAVVEAVPAAGGDPRELFGTDPVAGADLVLSLDERLQREAERLLADVGPASAVVALRPSTGEVLAVADGPGSGGQDLATFGQYAPGSTMKIVTSLALLRAGLTPDSTAPCPPTVTVDGKVFTNYSDYPAGALGRIPLRTALANSCNTAFISQREQVPTEALAAAAGALGLGVDHDVGFPAYFGDVPATAGSETVAAADLIGQGEVLASPLSMAAVIASVQAGHVVVPSLVTSPAPPADATAPATPLTAAEASTLQAMLRGVVTDGSARALLDVPGPPVIAKTGTAEFGTGPDLATHAWMVAAQGDLAVAVFVDVGASGSATAGPILEAFLRAAAEQSAR